MIKRTKIIIIIAAVIFIISVIGTVYVLRPPESQNVVILQDGVELYRFDLSSVENQTIVVESLDGTSSNTITIEDGKIRISEAECPDQTCVKTGELRSEDIPIVCLPNKLIIRFCGEGE